MKGGFHLSLLPRPSPQHQFITRHRRMATIAWKIAMWVTTILLFALGVVAAPQVNFPFNSQYPPVARAGELYNFQFASTTFQPGPDRLQYSLIGNPTWLSLNSRNRTLSGTPGSSDAGTVTFTIAAAGEAGAVANMESKLLVSDSDSPTTNGNISQSLSGAGQLSGPKTLTLPPSKPFDIKFPSDTFKAPGKSLLYHATLADHTPLPSWISFDASSLHFAGIPPPLTSSPQSYEILLIASDGSNYAVASLSFTLVISNHQLLFKPFEQTVDISKGDRVDFNDLRGRLFLDDAPIADGDIQSATAEVPSWLSFDTHTFALTGSPPSGLISQDITVAVKDRFGDTAKAAIHLEFKSQLFGEEVGQLNITAGEHFDYKIPRSVLTKNDETISINFGPLEKWLQFNPGTFIIYGTIPEDFAPQDVEATLTATSEKDKSRDSQTFRLHVSGAGTRSYTGSTVSTTSEQPSATNTVPRVHEQANQSKPEKAAVVVGIAVGATVVLLLALVVIVRLCRRKRKLKEPTSPRSPKKTDISRPIMREEEWEDVDRTLEPDLEKGGGDGTLLDRAPEHPPRLDLDLTVKGNDSRSVSSSIGDGEAKILTAFDNSPWGFKDEAGPSHHPPDSMKIRTQMVTGESYRPTPPTKRRRRTTTVYRDSYRSAGLPINRRLTGLGHGCNTHSPSRSNGNLSAIRRPRDCISWSSHSTAIRSTSILSTAPSAFPKPPTARHTTQLMTPMESRRSIRVVSSTCDSLLDCRTLDEKRQSYIRKRASAQSPFFGASSSRVSSSSYRSPAFANEGGPSKTTQISPLATSKAVTPGEDIIHKVERELPESLRTRKPSATPSVATTNREFAGSLRKPPTQRSFAMKDTTSSAGSSDRVQKQYERPDTVAYTRPVNRRSSARESLRAHRLKASLNILTGSEIFEDAEMSESAYSTEEEGIEANEKRRDTVKPSQFTLPPLKLKPLRGSKRESKRSSKRDPTPYSLIREHGGTENRSSTYSLAVTSKEKGKAKDINISQSPERPKTSHRRNRSTYHSSTESHATAREGTQRQSQNRPLLHQHSNKSHQSRHSHKSSRSHHSRSHSRTQSTTTNHVRDRSWIQSSAFPYFEPPPVPLSTADANKSPYQDKSLPQTETTGSLLPRDLSDNILNYGLYEDPQIEELASNSIGFRTSNGRITTSARRSRLAQLTSHPNQNSKLNRDTAIPPSTPTSATQNYNYRGGVGLGLSLLGSSLGRTEEALSPESERGRERTPLSVIGDGNMGSPNRLRIVEGKERRPVSVEVDEEGRNGGKGKRTRGGLKAVLGGHRGGREERVRGNEAFL
ncbi:hypothetical protein K469DRAFT_676269 [Zopfia rhizophila CBS 207.26]|uniref:Dystroglycan-type cadherin-like domain-containing protein n=1 Tax=Zopfia rhizophila CBS 207.26 TaxID=1314779 RepID=A0A6A6DF54_9PEZI|nr:hypothetical protein K469DRAFT_676269 [Zopfia rhizophila CBS 207.26]